MNKKELIDKILEIEWEFFNSAQNIGGRASCQDNKGDFTIMRSSQWETLNEDILKSYLNDLEISKNTGQNLIVDKYARMMEYNSPEEYNKIKHLLPKIEAEKTEIINKIVPIYLEWELNFSKMFPKIFNLGRPLKSERDDEIETSIETYLKGELLSYSKDTLKLYYDYVIENLNSNKNLVLLNMENVLKMQGFESLEKAENYIK